MKSVDYQRQKVYKWEQATGLYEPYRDGQFIMGQPQAQAFVDQVCRDYGVTHHVPLKYKYGRSRGTAYGASYIIIGNQYQYPRYLLHEIAHIILHFRHPATRYGAADTGIENRHGPQFVQLLMELRVRYCEDNLQVMQGAAVGHRLIVSNTSAIDNLLAAKTRANQAGDKDAAKLIRRQIRALSRQQLKEAAGSHVQAPTPVVRRPRTPKVYSVQCLECLAKYEFFPSSERCRKCGGTDLDWLD